MNWEALAATGEFVGGIAVIVSIIYLALQVRSSAVSSKAQGQRDNMDVFTFFAPLHHKPNRDIFRKGTRNFDGLSDDEKLHFHSLFHPLVSQYQSIYADHKLGLMDEIAFESWSGAMITVLSSVGVHQWWQGAKIVYAVDFQQAIDEAISDTNAPSLIEALPYMTVQQSG